MKSALLPLLLFPTLASAAVSGRYVRYSSPLLSMDTLYRLEVYSGGQNILPEVPASAVNGYFPVRGAGSKHFDDKTWKGLVQGKVNRAARAPRFVRPKPLSHGLIRGGSGAYFEVDLGKTRKIDRIEALYDTKGAGVPRIVTVLDENRKVIWSRVVSVTEAPFNDGVIDVTPQEGEKGMGEGRTLALDESLLTSSSQMLPEFDVPPPKDAQERLARFKARHSEEAIHALADEFFGKMDLEKPGLEKVAALYRGQRDQEALEAYRTYFFDKIAGQKKQGTYERARAVYSGPADDLVHDISSTVGFGSLPSYVPPGGNTVPENIVGRFTFQPGAFPWAYLPDDPTLEYHWDSKIEVGRPYPAGFPEKHTGRQQVFINMARSNSRPGEFTQPLLSAYRVTGNPEYLKAWNALTWDWGENANRDLEKSRVDLRNMFVKDYMTAVASLLVQLAETDAAQKQFRENVDPAALAKLLLASLDETPTYWRVARKSIFNHTYNAFIFAFNGYAMLDDFYAGERLVREMNDQLHRILTYSTTRDGSMIEVGDDGHLVMHLRLLWPLYSFTKDGLPYWTDKETVTHLKDLIGEMQRFQVRQLSPTGIGGRDHSQSHFQQIWGVDLFRRYGGDISRPLYQTDEWLREPDTRAILERVYGRGADGKRKKEALPPEMQASYDEVAAFYGDAPVPPVQMVSIWMPYAGLHYLRGGWDFLSPHAHMMSFKKGNESGAALGRKHLLSTAFSLTDYAMPLLWADALSIEGQRQNCDYMRRTGLPGSKTDRMTEAPEKPIDARWFTDDWFDFAEGRYEGAYRFIGTNYVGAPPLLSKEVYRDAKAERWIVQFRPARLFLQLDRLQPGPDAAGRQVEVTLPMEFFIGASGGKKAAANWKSAPLHRNASEPATAPKNQSAGGGLQWAQLHLDDKAKQLSVEGGGLAGITMRQFTATPVAYAESGEQPWKPRNNLVSNISAGKLQGVKARFSVGDSLLVATLYDTQKNGEEARMEVTKSISEPQQVGFDIREPTNGATLSFRATRGKAGRLEAGPLVAEAEGLVLAGSDGEVRGMLLGCHSATWNGEKVSVGSADFAFRVEKGHAGLVMTPIRRPLGPPDILPAETVFSEPFEMKLSASAPGTAILYTLDGSDPVPGAKGTQVYSGPVRVEGDTFVKTRTVRKEWLEGDGKIVPLRSDGTDYSMIGYGRFHKRAPQPAVAVKGALLPGLSVEYFESSWRILFANLSPHPVLPVKGQAISKSLLDPQDAKTLRRTEGPFGLRYSGYLEVPQEGVYTFYGPAELVRNIAEPGYDLRVWIDGEEWDPGTDWHGLGEWSIPLKEGAHRIVVTFADARDVDKVCPESGLAMGYPMPHAVWKGDVPVLEMSGPKLPRQAVPADWLRRVEGK